jgi:hypothetical protein
MFKFAHCKDMDRVVGKLVKQGWVYSRNAHGRVTHPSGKYVTFSITPSDRYAFKQLERDVKRLLKQVGEAS